MTETRSLPAKAPETGKLLGVLIAHGVDFVLIGGQAGISHGSSYPSYDLDVLYARTRDNILEPRELWELVGQVPNVVFPAGLTVSETDEQGFAPDEALVRVYYGGADTVVGLAEATVGKLVAACQHE